MLKKGGGTDSSTVHSVNVADSDLVNYVVVL